MLFHDSVPWSSCQCGQRSTSRQMSRAWTSGSRHHRVNSVSCRQPTNKPQNQVTRGAGFNLPLTDVFSARQVENLPHAGSNGPRFYSALLIREYYFLWLPRVWRHRSTLTRLMLVSPLASTPAGLYNGIGLTAHMLLLHRAMSPLLLLGQHIYD